MTTLVGLNLRGRRVLVAGGGPVAARRAAALEQDGARVVVVAPSLCEDLAALHQAGRLSWREGEVAESDVEGAWLVHSATGDAAVDNLVVAWAHDRGTFCICAREAASGSAVTPATSRHGDVVLGVASVGAPDPGRSVAVRDALAEVVRSGAVPLRRVRTGAGRVVLVGGGPGDVDLLTLRGRRALAEADVVVTDRLGPTGVLAELDPAVEVVDVGKAPGRHAVPQDEINRILVERARRGEVVVRLKGGDPFVLGRGGEEVLACAGAGVPVEVVPGVSSAFAAPASAGIPVTHRGTSAAVLVTSGHEGLDAAARAMAPQLGPGGGPTLIMLMGVSRLHEIVDDLVMGGAHPLTPVAVVERGTTADERTTRAVLADVVAAAGRAGVRAPAVLVIGAVAVAGLLEPVRLDG